MAWYKTGTVNVRAGSAIVEGVGTQWQSPAVRAGHFLVGPDGAIYEIAAVSLTQITLASPYAGADADAQPYAIAPTSTVSVELHSAVTALIGQATTIVESTTQAALDAEAAIEIVIEARDVVIATAASATEAAASAAQAAASETQAVQSASEAAQDAADAAASAAAAQAVVADGSVVLVAQNMTSIQSAADALTAQQSALIQMATAFVDAQDRYIEAHAFA